MTGRLIRIVAGLAMLSGIALLFDESVSDASVRMNLSALPAMQPARVAAILPTAARTVCVIGPYGNTLPDGDPSGRLINAHLRSIQFVGDEGHWTIATDDGRKVQIYRIRRSPDIWDSAAPRAGDVTLPIRHSPSGTCLPYEQAKVARIILEDRSYLVFGT